MVKSVGDTTASISPRELQTEKVRAVGVGEPVRVQAGSPLRETIERMQLAGGECALVCQEGRLAGIVTERDVLNKVLGRDIEPGAPVDQIMTPDPDTLGAEATLGQALEMMDRGGYRTVPLVDDEGTVVGVLHQQDVLEYVAEAFPQEILNLPPRPHQRAQESEGA